MTDVTAQEFLELLKNPQRARIKKIIKNFKNNVRHYGWDTNVDVYTSEANGTHVVKVSCRDRGYFAEIDRITDAFFPASDDYSLNIGQRNPHEYNGPPDGDLIYTKRFQVIER